jgi:dihydrofolate synthase/folylpolyglutamate synthase
VECDLPGHYQRWNIPTAVCIADHLARKGWRISDADILAGIRQAAHHSGLRGRMTLLRDHPAAIADIAHNEAGIREVLAQIAMTPHRRLHIVWGMVSDKDIDRALGLLPRDARYYFVRPDLPRGLEVEALVSAAGRFGLTGKGWPSVAEGYASAQASASAEDLIYVGGSTFVVAEVI